jgi:pyruvate dehydrogenase E2 component (dihydrolipoamide acetyltransferase)
VAAVGKRDITGGLPSVPAATGTTAKGETERRELSKPRQAYARRVAESKATIPHLYAREDVALGQRVDGVELFDRVLAACGRALRELPELNAAYRDAGLELHSRVNVGFVTPGPESPLVPTLFDADLKTPGELASERSGLAAAAAAGTLASPSLAGGTFTVSAPAGVAEVDPIVAGGQAAALSVSAPRETVVLRDGGPAAGLSATLALACDARIVLPGEAAAFLGRVAELVEHGADA